MPFYGRPSKSCESCRFRRIKCDRLSPVCSQCKRAGKNCGGYREISDLLFRDENDRTAQRSAVAKSKAELRRKLLDESAARNPMPKSRSFQPGPVVQAKPHLLLKFPVMPAVIPSSPEDQGLKFFFNRFAMSVQNAKNDSFLETTDLAKSPIMAAIPNELPLRDAVIAVGLAAMSNVTHDKSFLLIAREKYAAALSTVRAAVENPQRAKPMVTFKLIVMLSVFEMVCCPSGQLDNWILHLDGIAALLKQASFSAALNIDARPQIQYLCLSVVRYFSLQREIPSCLLNWSPNKIATATSDEEPAIDLLDILIRFTKLHYTLRHDLDIDARAAASAAASFDTELDEWEKNLPDQWAFTLEESTDCQNTFNGKYLAFNEVWSSRILNHYFWGRLVVNEMVLTYLARLPSSTRRTLQQRQRALDTISRLSINICASAASQMGAFESGPSFAPGSRRLPPLNGAFILLFPLTMAGGSAGSPDEVHEWVVRTLRKIGVTMGIQRALLLIPKLKESRENKKQQNWEIDQLYETLG